MKSNVSKNIVITSGGVDGPKSFGMKVNEKAFSILISGIYQHKIKAIIRELSTNAWDSHVQAKNLFPFDVHLPTNKNPVFYIRDYGIGLDKEQLENIYFNFFASTKEDSNEYTGFIGIGSKVPLCYNTKSFNVSSYKNGTQYVYSCFIGENNIPDYKLEYTGPTTEKNGMKVQVTVDPKDIYEFKLCSEEVYKWFDVKPNFISDIKPNVSLNIKEKNDLFIIYDKKETVAVMGNIAYPIVECHALSKYNHLINENLALKFDIGEIEFNAAREGLEYTNKTTQKIINRFDEIIKYVNSNIKKNISSAKSSIDAIRKFYEFKSKYNMFGICDHINEVEFQGKKYKISEKIEKRNTYYYYGRTSTRNEFYINDKTIIVVNDMKIGAKSRCSEYSKKEDKIVILLDDNVIPGHVVDSEDYILASTLPAPPKNPKRSSKVTSFMEMLNNNHVTYAWKDADVNTVTNKYYIIRKGYYCEHNDVQYKPSDIYTRQKMAGLTGPIYGVSKKEEKDIINLGFKNIINECNTLLDSKKKNVEKNIPYLENYNYLEFMYSIHHELIKNIASIINSLSKDHELVKYYNEYTLFIKEKNKADLIKKEIGELKGAGYNINVKTYSYNTSYYYNSVNTDINNAKKEAEKHPLYCKYPLLTISHYKHTNSLLHYVIGVNYADSSTKF